MSEAPNTAKEALARASVQVPDSLLDRDAERWANEFLRRRGYRDARIIAVDADAILFTTFADRPMTGWLKRNPHSLEPQVRFEPGFPAVAHNPWPDDADYEEVASEIMDEGRGAE
jgi:hypothetical protein